MSDATNNRFYREAVKRPSDRLSAEKLEHAAEKLRDHRLRGHVYREWSKIEESDRQVYRDDIRVMIDALGDSL